MLLFGKKDKKEEKDVGKDKKGKKDKHDKKEHKDGIAALALKATGKAALWAAKKTVVTAANVATASVVEATSQIVHAAGNVASSALAPASAHSSASSKEKKGSWAQHNAPWLKEEGRIFLQKIYAPETSFADAHHAGSLIHADNKLFMRSGLKKKSEHKPLYHQLNRSSITKTVKSVNRLVGGNKVHANARREYLIAIVSVMWHIHDLAIQAKQELNRGSYKIVDPDEKLFQFLMGYARFATGKEQPEFLLGANDFAYKRDPQWYLSSHYTHPSFQSCQYGIDMRLWGGHPTLDILPNESSHMLFGQVLINGTKHLFLKTEQIGLGHPLEYLEHGSHLFFSKDKAGAKYRRESTIPLDLNKAFEEYLAASPGLKKPTPYTISKMYEMITKNVNSSSAQQKAIREFAHCLEKHSYEIDASIRTGQEVILDFTPLKPSEKSKSVRMGLS